MTNGTQAIAPVLSVRDLSIALPTSGDRSFAVENISFDVNPGEIVCVVGESGSGKSVTAFTVMGLLPKILQPSSGSVKLLGEELIGMSEQRLRQLRGNRMSMIFQEPMTALNPVKTVGDQIGEVFKWHGLKLSRSERDARVERLMADVHLPDVAHLRNSYPHELSGGQRQRVMIAMALAMSPALLIADEPTTALDVTTQAQILKLIRELQTNSSTGVLFITHDFGVVTDIADRVLVMRSGKVVEQGRVSEVLKTPREAYTRMLLDAVPGIEPPPPRALSQDGAPILSIQGVGKRYAGRRRGLFGSAGRSVQALDDVNLAVRRGETLGIVGQSGSGKSTLARCVMRFVDTSDGSIRFEGREIQNLAAGPMRPFRRKIQMIFQDPYRSLNPRRTVGDSIIEGPLNYGTSREEAWQDALRLLELVGVPATAMERYPHQFSGGQRQRIAIARALAMKPDLLVADEAVSALDVSVQAQVLDLIEAIREKLGLTILFVTHDLRVAARLCDSLAVMLNGKVVEYGRTAHVFANPRSDYTKALLAAAPGHLQAGG